MNNELLSISRQIREIRSQAQRWHKDLQYFLTDLLLSMQDGNQSYIVNQGQITFEHIAPLKWDGNLTMQNEITLSDSNGFEITFSLDSLLKFDDDGRDYQINRNDERFSISFL